MIKVNAVGKQCPIPVVMTKKAIEDMTEPGKIQISVDNSIAVQNLSKMAHQSGYDCVSEKINDDLYNVTFDIGLSITKSEDIPELCIPDSREKNTVVVISSSTMGKGDDELGAILMKGFIYALAGQDKLPTTILLYNSGAKLSIEGSDSLADLKLLESQGVEILTCGTCLNHYLIADKLAVGEVTNMYVIAQKMVDADKIIQP